MKDPKSILQRRSRGAQGAICAAALVLLTPSVAANTVPVPNGELRTTTGRPSQTMRWPHEQRGDSVPAVVGPRRTASPVPVMRDGYASVQVNVDEFGNNILGDAANEPSIAIDPTNPNRIVIGWRQFDTVESSFRQAGYAYSRDAGRTWTFPGVLDEGVFRSDPVLAADADGHFYYYSLNAGAPSLHCDLFVSTDGGATWSDPVPAFGGDKPWMTIDCTDGIGRGNIYAVWSHSLTRSTDGGETFEPATAVPGAPMTIAVGPGGELYGLGPSADSQAARIGRSSNAQDPDAAVEFEYAARVDIAGQLAAGHINPIGMLGQFWVAGDHSQGSTRGNVYALASVEPSDVFDPPDIDPLDVHFRRSEDRGETWSPIARINDDVRDTGAWQWFGTLSVAPNGRLDAFWYDTRNDANPAEPDFSEVYYSFSMDSGATWSENVPVSPPFNHFLGGPSGSPKLGDYIQAISDDVGVSLAHAATFNGEQDVWLLRIGDYDCNGNGIGDSEDLASGAAEDLNGNGIPDTCDCLGDLNLDWRISLVDLAELLGNYGTSSGAADADGDLDADGDVDTDDLQILLRNYGRGCP